MSRSIHTTHRSIDAALQKEYATPEAKLEAYEKAHGQLRRKRLIKRQVKAERKRARPPLQGTAISTIPIEVRDEGSFVHHGASPEDLRAILSALPEAASLGISRIQLLLGSEYLEKLSEGSEPQRDPYIGRVSCELLPGVFCGKSLGTFDPKNGVISVFAFVFDPSRLLLPRKACELYLRLRALNTFVHEVAHHHDETQRARRGRWLADNKDKVERYASTMEAKWARTIVVPHLEQAYPAEVAELLNWLEGWVGVRLSLGFFIDNANYYFLVPSAFENWMEELPKYKTPAEARFAFVKEIHFADQYEACLQILEGLLEEAPDDLAALALKADTLVHLKRYDEAFQVAQQIIGVDPKNADAWEVCADVWEARHQWNALLEACSHWEACVFTHEWDRQWIPLYRAVAYCGLENWSEMERAIEARLALWGGKPQGPKVAARRRDSTRKIVFRRAGKPLPEHLGGPSK